MFLTLQSETVSESVMIIVALILGGRRRGESPGRGNLGTHCLHASVIFRMSFFVATVTVQTIIGVGKGRSRMIKGLGMGRMIRGPHSPPGRRNYKER